MLNRGRDLIKYTLDKKTDIYLNAEYKFSSRNILQAGERCLAAFKAGKNIVSRERHRKVIKTEFMGRKAYAKSYSPHHTDHTGNKLKNISLLETTAMREFRVLRKIIGLGLPAVLPLAVIEKSIRPFYKESIIITEAEKGVEASSIVSSEEISLEKKREIFERAWKYLEELQRAGIFDSDYKFRNLLYWEDNCEFSLVIFDKERARKMLNPLAGIKVRGKFIANWINLLVNSGALSPACAEKEIEKLKARLRGELNLSFLQKIYLDRCIKRKLKVDIPGF